MRAHYTGGFGSRHGVLMVAALVSTFLAGSLTAQVNTVTLDSPSDLILIRVMVLAGSAQDPAGLEGLAAMTAQLLLEGSFGDAANPVTKEMVADITRPWGGGATPRVLVEKETSTFKFTVPRDVFDTYLNKVLTPLFNLPLFSQKELDRLRQERQLYIESSLRLESTEQLGLWATDLAIHAGTPYGHIPTGTVDGLGKITREDVRRFYKSYYHRKNFSLALSTSDAKLVKSVKAGLKRMGRKVKAKKFKRPPFEAARPLQGRDLLIISQPTTIATGIHAGFPIDVDRNHPDYWPLYVANISLGTHRDGFGRLYYEIRQTRGYNYGNYSYMEWFYNRPFNLFPPTNTPRKQHYFNLWIRPVGHEYAHHLTKAMTWELNRFIQEGLTEEEVDAAKNKARILYLSLAETAGRLLDYKLDDAFYGMQDGYLDQYLKAVEAVTPAQVNAAITRHLQVENMRYVIVTSEEWADRLAADIISGENATGKSMAAYNFEALESDGETQYVVPDGKQPMLDKDALWEAYPLNLSADRVRVIKSTALFQSVQ